MNQEERTFLELIERHQGIIHKVCRIYAHEAEDRQDLFQEIVYQLWRSKAKFAGKSKFSSWMYRVALHTAITHLRKATRSPKPQDLSEALAEAATEHPPRLEQEEQKAFLYQAIEQLSPVEKAVIVLYLEEHSYDEIADIMGMTRNHVGVKLNRIKNKLREWLVPFFS